MSEELKVTFGGEVSEKVGPELTQALDQLSRSLDSLLAKGTYSGPLPVLQPSTPPVAAPGLILPEWTAERRSSVTLPPTPGPVLPPPAKPAQWWHPTPEGEEARRRELERIQQQNYGTEKKNRPQGPGFRELPASERKSLEQTLADMGLTPEPPQKPVKAPPSPEELSKTPPAPPSPPPKAPPSPEERAKIPPPPPIPKSESPPILSPIAQRAPQFVGSAVGGAVGALTGSPTMGAIAGSGASLGIEALGGTAALAMGGLAMAAILTAEALKTVKGMLDEFRESGNRTIASLSQVSGILAGGEAKTVVAVMKQQIEQSRNPGIMAGSLKQQQAERVGTLLKGQLDASRVSTGLGTVATERANAYIAAHKAVSDAYGAGNLSEFQAAIWDQNLNIQERLGIPPNWTGQGKLGQDIAKQQKGEMEENERIETAMRLSPAYKKAREHWLDVNELLITDRQHNHLKEQDEAAKAMLSEMKKIRKAIEKQQSTGKSQDINFYMKNLVNANGSNPEATRRDAPRRGPSRMFAHGGLW